MTEDNTAGTDSTCSGPRQARAAANMAEALSFLIRIARLAGMQNVAVNLAEVRKEVQAISAQAHTSDQEKLVPPVHRNRNQVTRLN